MPYYTESPAEGRKQLLFDQDLAVAVRRSPMGGGWIWGTTDRGKAVLAEYYGEEPAPIAPMGGWPAYIVGPNEAEYIADYLMKEGIAWHIVP